MTRIVFTSLAAQELKDARTYYEMEFAGLGKAFSKEMEFALRRISDYPQAWSVERGEIRKCLLHKFPYKILYSIEPDHLLVVAVAHQHQQPDYWVDRC